MVAPCRIRSPFCVVAGSVGVVGALGLDFLHLWAIVVLALAMSQPNFGAAEAVKAFESVLRTPISIERKYESLDGFRCPEIWLRHSTSRSILQPSNPLSAATPSNILCTEDLNKVYPDGSVSALVNVNLQVPAEQFLAIMGPSGSGKSTLLNVLGGLDEPTSGVVYFRGQPLAQWPSLDRYRHEQIGFVFQSFHLLPTFTAIENVQIPMFHGHRSPAERARVASELLDVVGMSHRKTHLPSRLSVGERQRVSIARALANDPPIMLADEPTGNLDTKTGADILDLFDRLRRERGMTLVVVTHTQEVASRADRVIMFRDGRIISDEMRTGNERTS